MNSSVCVVILLFLCLENYVAGIICNSYFYPEPEPHVHENTPTTKKPDFTNYYEGTEANIVCESTQLYHLWFQGYQNSTSKKQVAIGNIPLQRGVKKTHYVITVEKFDANTVIYCENDDNHTDEDDKTSHGLSKKPFDWLTNIYLKIKYFKTRIQLFDDADPPIIQEPTNMPYSEKKNISFSCEEYAKEKNYTFVGVLNTTSNMIVTYQTISADKRFNLAHNGTILCCVYYEVNGTADEKWITRHVAKKTLLVYDETVQQERLEGKEITTETGQAGNHTTTIYITTAVAGVLILLVTIVICKKRCRKQPVSDSKVLYVDLDLLRNVRPDSISRPAPEAESPYAQIIGVLKPDQ